MSKCTPLLREATLDDTEAITAFLSQIGLSAEGVLAVGSRYWLAEDAERQVIGVVGLEYGAVAVLLRSAGVCPTWRRQGLGVALVQHALAAAATAGYRRVYLFSTGAGDYWQRHDFRETPVSELVAALPAAPQVKQYEALGWLPTEIAWVKELM